MKRLILALVFCLFALQANAKTWIVDVNGGGDFTTIPAALNASVSGDTIWVWPGEYRDPVDLNKAVVVIGSGYENTKIIVDNDPALVLRSGAKIMWFTITSKEGSGVEVMGGVLTNCVMRVSAGSGAKILGNNARVANCVFALNNQQGIWVENVPHVSTILCNCIFFKNVGYGVYEDTYYGSVTGHYNCFYGNGGHYRGSYIGREGDLYGIDPNFISDYDYRISETSPCWDAGIPDEIDPDYSRSDMGVYGGPDAQVVPVVTDVRLKTNQDGTVTITATGKATF